MSTRTESSLLKRTMQVLLALAMALYFAPGLLLAPQNAWADTTNVTENDVTITVTDGEASVDNLAKLKLAVKTSSVATINVTADITVDEAVSITRNLAIDGRDHVIQVATPYVNEAGSCPDSDYSTYSVFTIGNGVTAKLNNMTIYGGYGDSDAGAGAGGIVVNGTLVADNVNISRSYRGLYIGGSSAKACLTSCNIVRNVCGYGGGAVCARGTLIMDGCSLSENRSTSGGGGAIEVKGGGNLYANNTVIANNCSSEIGGAVNVYSSNVYLMNCTVTGNVTTASNGLGASKKQACGGGVGINSGSLHAVNSLFLNNMYLKENTENNWAASDIGLYDNATYSLYKCCYGTVIGSDNSNNPVLVSSSHNSPLPNNTAIDTVTTSPNAQPETVFASYRRDGILCSNSGSTADFTHPVLVSKSGTYALYAPLKDNSPAKSGGTKTYFDCDSNLAVAMSYNDANGTKMSLVNTAATEVKGFYEASAGRSTTSTETGSNPPVTTTVIGASGMGSAASYTVKLASQPTGGSVTGISLYGNSIVVGSTAVEVSFVVSPNSGWNIGEVSYTTSSSSTPVPISDGNNDGIYSFNMPSADVVVKVEFTQVTRSVKLSAAPTNGTVTGINTTDTAKGVGSTVSFTTAPADGYKVKSVIAAKTDDPSTAVSVTSVGSNTYSFTMPDHAVTVTVEFEPIPSPPVYVPAPDPTPSVTPSSPTGVDDFGTISGVSDRMQYKLEGTDTWTDVPAGVTQLTGLPAGTYLVRYKGYSSYTKVVVAAAPAYSVEVKPTAGGTATADKTTAMKGETVTFSATADEGFNLRGWMIGDEFVEADSITMPASDIIVEPVFTPVQKLFTAKAKASTKSATLSWNPVEGAVKYRVYLAKADGKLKRVTTIEVPAADESEDNDDAIQAACAYTSKKLKAGTIYKLRVVAVAEDGSKISSSPIAYVTPKGKSYANASKLSVSKKSVSLGAGEKAKVSAKVTRLDSKGKKLLKVSGVKKIRYMSSEPTIVKVTKYGNITALRAGTAYVYAIAADGVYKRIKVTVE